MRPPFFLNGKPSKKAKSLHRYRRPIAIFTALPHEFQVLIRPINALGTSAMWSADGFCSRTRYSVGRCASSLASARTPCRLRHLHVEHKTGLATRTLRLAGFETHRPRRPGMLCVYRISQSALSKPRPIVFPGQSRRPQERIKNMYVGDQIRTARKRVCTRQRMQRIHAREQRPLPVREASLNESYVQIASHR
jgi:hypothetical protein